jgi:hypothetical protein
MKTCDKTFLSTERICTFLSAEQLYSGEFAICTKPINREYYEVNFNYPIFDTREQAEKFLSENFEEV